MGFLVGILVLQSSEKELLLIATIPKKILQSALKLKPQILFNNSELYNTVWLFCLCN